MPTPDRLPQPPGPPTLASILADHEREKRRQQRPVSKSGLPVAGEDDGLIQIAVEMDLISEQGYGTISGTGGSFSVSFSLPSEGLWLLTPKFDPHFGARIEVDEGDSGYIGIGVSAATSSNSWSESVVHPLAMPYRSSPTNVSLRTLAGSWRAPFVYDTNFLEGTAAERLAMSIDVTGGATGTWSSASGGGALINVRLYGVRLGPSLL